MLVVIIAWAHLILYGEEATKLAQKEGEEAAAAYEQEKRDIAEGRIPGLPAKTATDKKKKAVPKKEKKAETSVEKGNHKSHSGVTDVKTKKRKVSSRDNPNVEKKQRTMTSALKTEKELLLSILAKGVLKVSFAGTNSIAGVYHKETQPTCHCRPRC